MVRFGRDLKDLYMKVL